MPGNAKFRWFFLAPMVVALLVVAAYPIISWAGELEDKQEKVRQNPDNSIAHYNLGVSYAKSGRYQEAIASFKEVIRVNPNFAGAHYNLGLNFGRTKNGFDAIRHTLIAAKLFERQNNSKLAAFAKSMLLV